MTRSAAARAAELSLDTLRQARAAWAEFKEARRAIGRHRNPADALDAVNRALLAERELDRLLGPREHVLSTFDTPAPAAPVDEIPGRPGWPVEFEPDEPIGG